MSGMVAFLAGMGSGYLNAQDKQRRNAIEEEELQARRDERAFQKGERERATRIRTELGEAAAPVAPVDGEVYQPSVDDDGNTMPANPTAGTLKVGMQRFTDRAAADAAAVQANTPAAVSTRMADVLARNGEPMQAQQMRTAARQDQIGQLQLDEMQTKALNQQYDNDLNGRVNSWDDLATFVNSTKGDGRGGELKIAAKPSADGKSIEIHRLGADGTTTALPYKFSNDNDGLTRAKHLMSRSVTASDKLNHLYQQSQIERQDKALEETVRHHRAAEGIAADNNAMRREIATMRAEASRAAAEAKPSKLPEAVKLQYNGLQKEADAISDQIVKVQAEGGGWDPQRNPSQGGLQVRLASLQIQMRHLIEPYGQRGGMTPDDPLGLFGQPSAGAGKSSGPVDRPANRVNGIPARGEIPREHIAAPPAVRDQTIGERVSSSLGAMQRAGREYQAIEARFREAGAGGPPLSAQEIAIGRRFGLIPTS